MKHEPSSINNVLMRYLFHLKMGEAALVVEHFNKTNMIVSQLSLVEIDYDDEIRALILLFSLPDS